MLKHQTGRRPNWGKAVVKGTVTALVSAFLCAAILAKLVDSEVIKMEQIGYGILIGHLLAVFMGTKVAIGGAGKEGLYAACATGAGYYLALLIVGGLFFGGSFAGLGVTLLLTTLATLGAVLTGGEKRMRKGHKHYKIPK